MNARTSLAVIIGALALAVAPVVSAADVTCDSCADCQAKLTSGLYTTVTLATDIIDHSGSCIDLAFGESNVTLDCDGHLIDGDGTWVSPTSAVAMRHGTGNTVANCSITDFNTAILLIQVDNITVHDNLLTGLEVGIDLSNVELSNFFDNTIQDNSTGIRLSNANSNTLESNTVCGNFPWDIYYANGIDNEGYDNTCNLAYFWDDEGTTDCTFSCDIFGCGFESGDFGDWSEVNFSP